MKTYAIHDIIVSIKNAVKEKELSSDALIKLVFQKTGVWLSPATIGRILADDSEEKGFNSKTLDAIQRALLSEMAVSDDETVNETYKLYEASLTYKDAEIEELQSKIEELKAAHEKELMFLHNQIDKKDERMDRKDQIIDKLLSQVLVCSHCPVTKGDD